MLGKAATWLLYLGVGCSMVTRAGDGLAARDLLDRLRARARVARVVRRQGAERGPLHEGRRDGGRRGHAPAPADLEPAEADGADRRQAVHGAHPRAAARARLRGRRRHGRVPAAGDPLATSATATRSGSTSSTRSRRARSAPPARCASRATCSTRRSSSSPATRSATSTSAQIVEFHKEKGAAVTIGLKSVENPLEFGIVVTDEDGRVERFLEKPSWGQVFSDTINTGIYVLEPEVLRHIPTDRPYDFSKELFPLLLEMGRPIYGYVCDGYWQDIGNLDQYRQANFDALDEKVRLNDPAASRSAATSGSARASRSTTSRASRGRRSSATTARISPESSVGPYSVLGPGVHAARARARLAHASSTRPATSAAARSSRARSSGATATCARTRASTRASRSATR